jgi:flagellar biosynthesis chaperone FliJ
MAKITLETISKEEIIQMAQYIQQLEQLTKDQKGYIIQLQAQLMQRGKQLANAKQQIPTLTNFIEVEAKIEL